MAHSKPLRVVLLAYDDMNLLDLSGPLQALSTVNRLAAAGEPLRYETIVASARGGSVVTSAGLPVTTVGIDALKGLRIDTLIAAGGSADAEFHADPVLVEWIARQASNVRRLCSVCTGAFLLAAAGQLTGRRVTTHWDWADRLQGLYPTVRVDADPLYIRDDKVWTSAGVTAGIDMTLGLIDEDFGHSVTIQTARQLVMFIKRSGGQSQFSAPLAAQFYDSGTFADLHAWIAAHITEELGVERLAAQASMSPRTFARTYAARVGRTPAKTVELIRLEAACRSLETTQLPLKRIAAEVGYSEEQNLRRVFVRHMGVGPLQYRASFSQRGAADHVDSLLQ
ncbi:MAG: DJ-1/PfpI family protein [Ramlibacter sp.]|nr:DJ-1/PfpI family protein [Ramlibacter sp.]